MESLHHLERVFQLLLQEHMLSFVVNQLVYLGLIISDKWTATNPAKSALMLKRHAPSRVTELKHAPSSVTELKGFLGLTCCSKKLVKC
jgi:hypothetical protein